MSITTLDWNFDSFQDASILDYQFCQKLKVTHTGIKPVMSLSSEAADDIHLQYFILIHVKF